MTDIVERFTEFDRRITTMLEGIQTELAAIRKDIAPIDTISTTVADTNNSVEDILEQKGNDALKIMLDQHNIGDTAAYIATMHCLNSLAHGHYESLSVEEAQAIYLGHPKMGEYIRLLSKDRDKGYPRNQFAAIAYIADRNGLFSIFEEFKAAYDAGTGDNAAAALRRLIETDKSALRTRLTIIYRVAHAFNSFQIDAQANFDQAPGTKMRGWNVATLQGVTK